MFKVIGTDTYLQELDKWSKQDYNAAEKIPKKLAENPYVGKQLSYPFLREKKIGGRIEKNNVWCMSADLKFRKKTCDGSLVGTHVALVASISERTHMFASLNLWVSA